MPRTIQQILSDHGIIKVGVGIAEDAAKLRKDFKIQVNGTLDLATYARRADPITWSDKPKKGGGGSLADLTALYIGRKMEKNKQIILSDWSEKLGNAQIDCKPFLTLF